MPQVACRVRTVKRIMHALFFDAKRPVAQIPVRERASVSGQFCATTVLPEVVKHYNNVRPRTGWYQEYQVPA